MGKIICLECKVILESLSVHDFKECGCDNGSFVDGGNHYTRVGGKELYKIGIWNIEKNRWEYLETHKKIKAKDLKLKGDCDEI